MQEAIGVLPQERQQGIQKTKDPESVFGMLKVITGQLVRLLPCLSVI